MMKKLICIVSFLFLAVTCGADTITVYPDGSGDYPTIQDAIDAASTGDTVIVAGGIYTEDVSCVSEITIHFTGTTTINGQVTTGSETSIIADADLTITSDSNITLGGPVTVAGSWELSAGGEIVTNNFQEASGIQLTSNGNIVVNGDVTATVTSINIVADADIDITGSDIILIAGDSVDIDAADDVIFDGVTVHVTAYGSVSIDAGNTLRLENDLVLDNTLIVDSALVLAGSATYLQIGGLDIVSGTSMDIANLLLYVDGEVETALDGWIANGSLFSSVFSSIDAVYDPIDNITIVVAKADATIYVDKDAVGSNDGTSWDDAYVDLQDGLNDPCLSYGDEIWVAGGTYYPSQPTDPCDPRTATFQLINGVALYGGFAGTEDPCTFDLADRDFVTNETILSGDLNNDDEQVSDPEDLLIDPNRSENSYHVVTGSGTDDTAVLDGFTIKGGNANWGGTDLTDHGGGMFNWSGSPKVANCTFSGNSANFGGGMFNGLYSSPEMTNCTFSGNVAGGAPPYGSGGGGGMANDNHSSPTLRNCLFSGNRAISASGQNWGGGMANWKYSDPCLVNCTFGGNEAGNYGGGINNADLCYPTLTNCILWGNTAPTDPELCDHYTSTTTVKYSNIKGGWPGEGNIGADPNDDPLFVDPNGPDGVLGTEDDNLRLFLFSPCIDVGDNSVVDPCSTDLDGNPRIMDGDNDSNSVVDMGAYELLTPIEVDVHIVPRVINRNNHLGRVIAIMHLGEGIRSDDVVRESFELYVGGLDTEPIGAIWQRVIGWGRRASVFALFDKAELMDAVEHNGRVELTVVGKLESGQYIYGSDTVRIVQPRRQRGWWGRRR